MKKSQKMKNRKVKTSQSIKKHQLINKKQLAVKVQNLWQKSWHYVVVVFFGLIVTARIWGGLSGFMIGDDANFHALRLQSAAHAWQDGQIVPQVDPTVLDGFGYSYNIFYGPLITYITALMRLVIPSWAIVVNLSIVLMMVLSGVAMCYVVNKISKKPVLAALAGVIYLTAPYHVLDLAVRVAVGELMTLMVAPLLILGLYQLVNQQKAALRNIVIAATVMLLSHNLSVLLFALMAVLYLVLNYRSLKNWKIWQQMLIAGGLIVGLTAFFTLPMLEAKFSGTYAIFNPEYSRDYMWVNAEQINRSWIQPAGLILDNYELTPGYTVVDTTSNIRLGLIMTVSLVGFLFIAKRIHAKPEKKFVTTLYIIAALTLLVMVGVRKWEWMPSILYSLQFVWRLLIIVTVTMSVVASYVIYDFIQEMAEHRQQLAVLAVGIIAVCLVSELIAYHPERHRDVSNVVDSSMFNGSVGWGAEYLPVQLSCGGKLEDLDCDIYAAYDYVNQRGEKIEIMSGKAKLHDITHDGTKWNFRVDDVQSPVKLELPAVWYPGYKATLNGQKITPHASDIRGLVELEVNEPGEVKVRYGMSLMAGVGLAISTITAIGIVVWWKWGWIKKVVKKNS